MYDDFFSYCVYYRKSSIKPPPAPLGGLFNLAAEDENQIQTSSW